MKKGASLASIQEPGRPERPATKVVACAYCRRRLADEYFFTCRKCQASYCYIHMSRHQACMRHTNQRKAIHPVAALAQSGGGDTGHVPIQAGRQFLVADSRAESYSSANV